MTNIVEPLKMNFPGPIGTKRRRMRSGGNVSTLNNNSLLSAAGMDEEEDISKQRTTQTSKCKGSTTIPIFLKKTYKMIDTCDPEIASWTEDGDMFVVKDPDLFATQVIPQYFDHNKFSSFARQLNFYGFRKMQSKPIRNSDFDAGTAKHVTFYNENFKRGRCDLLKKIQRSTRGGGTATPGDQSREVATLKDQVAALEQRIDDMQVQHEERVRRLEQDLVARMEHMMFTYQQQQRNHVHIDKATSVGTMNTASTHSTVQQQMPAPQVVTAGVVPWNTSPFPYQRDNSIASAVNSVANAIHGNPNPISSFHPPSNVGQMQAPSLPPHPKQKQGYPMGNLSMNSVLPPERLNSLRGISALSRGLSGLTRGASIESNTSAALMQNTWEDKFFSMLMLDGANDASMVDTSNLMPTPIKENPPIVSQDNALSVNKQELEELPEADDLSDVSSRGLHD